MYLYLSFLCIKNVKQLEKICLAFLALCIRHNFILRKLRLTSSMVQKNVISKKKKKIRLRFVVIKNHKNNKKI